MVGSASREASLQTCHDRSGDHIFFHRQRSFRRLNPHHISPNSVMHAYAFRGEMRLRILALLIATLPILASGPSAAQGTRLLRDPSIGSQHIAFAYGGDIWIVGREGGDARRLTSTPAVESRPYLSPDGKMVAFTSNRSGMSAVYVVPVTGGTPTRLTWYPAPSRVRGWTPDGSRVLYASSRENEPGAYDRLWTVPVSGGPSQLLPATFAYSGSISADGRRLVVDPTSRWDSEWRLYRGGQNRPLSILDLEELTEHTLPHEWTVDTCPVWLGDQVYFLSDRSGSVNVWSYDPSSGSLRQVTHFSDADVKWLSAGAGMLAIEYNGFIHTVDPHTGNARQLEIFVNGDFPWAEKVWQNVGNNIRTASLSPTGKRVVVEARGEIFTVPVEHGDARNLSRSTGAADRAPVWSPNGKEVAWFSDAEGSGYALHISAQDGLSPTRTIDLGESHMAWNPAWSPDGQHLAFVDGKVRVRVLDVTSGSIRTIDVGGSNWERGKMPLAWSPDSKWLAYGKTGSNGFRRIVLWSAETGDLREVTDALADAHSPAWDRGGRYLYFLASTDLALGSGFANTSAVRSDPTYGAYMAVLRAEDPSPFPPRSDEEPTAEQSADEGSDEAKESGGRAKSAEREEEAEGPAVEPIGIDWENLSHRIVPLPMPPGGYRAMASGPEGTVFIEESSWNAPGTVHKFVIADRKATPFAQGSELMSVSGDGQKLLLRQGPKWLVANAGSPSADDATQVAMTLRMHLDRHEEWKQIFAEAWQLEREYFYAPNLHGRDWDAVREKYEPLVQYVRHRDDLTYLLDQLGGELSVGHSYVGGGDNPPVDTVRVGVLGADLVPENGRWRFSRIYSSEAWNPDLTAPLAGPGIRVAAGHYLLAVDGVELTSNDDPYRLLDGTADRQTVLHVNSDPSMEGAWKEVVVPQRSESGLRRRAWVEDNRRLVDSLSNGRLAYVWVPNTHNDGLVSFDRYFFAQQDREGAIIDERFNEGGLLDDYMVDMMSRTLRAAITNEAPGGAPMRLPAGVLGPKVMIVNEYAGSGGDYLPWAFRRLGIGPLIGTRTWGGLVAAQVPYPLVDGGNLTAPGNAVFDPINGSWVAENVGIEPDIEVVNDARAVAEGRDPQIERAVQEALRMLDAHPKIAVHPPPFPTPAVGTPIRATIVPEGE